MPFPLGQSFQSRNDTSLTSARRKDALILDFSVNSKAVVNNAEVFNEFIDEIIKFVQNLSSECWHIDILCDGYFNSFFKSHTQEVWGYGQFFPFTKATNIPNNFESNFLKHNRNKVALNLFLAAKLLAHGFGGAIVFISVNSEVKCNTSNVSEEDLHIGSTREEADIKINVHLKHCLLSSSAMLYIKQLIPML